MNLKTRIVLGDPNPHLGPLISSYQDGSTTLEEARQVETHLLECEQCRSYYTSLEELRENIRALPDIVIPDKQLEERDYYRVMNQTIYPANRKRAREVLKKEKKK